MWGRSEVRAPHVWSHECPSRVVQVAGIFFGWWQSRTHSRTSRSHQHPRTDLARSRHTSGSDRLHRSRCSHRSGCRTWPRQPRGWWQTERRRSAFPTDVTRSHRGFLTRRSHREFLSSMDPFVPRGGREPTMLSGTTSCRWPPPRSTPLAVVRARGADTR
jgi:hypothetical protein